MFVCEQPMSGRAHFLYSVDWFVASFQDIPAPIEKGTAMPVEASIEDGIICIIGLGEWAVEDFFPVLSDAIEKLDESRPVGILFDMSEATIDRSTSQMKDIAKRLSALKRKGKLAVFTLTTIYFGLARMLQVFADESGFDVRPFYDKAKARDWLKRGM